jgi:hypothetical protein
LLLKADIGASSRHVRLVPKAAVSRCSEEQSYSITSSARASSVGGLSRPSTVVVIRLMTKSNLTDLLNQKVARLRPAENLLENIRD